jgi:hypothetical protein
MQREKIDYILDTYRAFCYFYPESVIKKTLNGAGPAGHGSWVRDTLFYKYCVTEPANVHDFLYSEYGPKIITRKEADDFFLYYMLTKLESQTEISKALNRPLVYSYYWSVRAFGWSFWTKNKV